MTVISVSVFVGCVYVVYVVFHFHSFVVCVAGCSNMRRRLLIYFTVCLFLFLYVCPSVVMYARITQPFDAIETATHRPEQRGAIEGVLNSIPLTFIEFCIVVG